MVKPDLSIVILSYNVRELLLACLESLYSSADKSDSWQVIVVDNNSSDDSAKAVRTQFPKVQIIETGKNLGFAAGNNVGIREAKSDLILFLNPDTFIQGKPIQMCIDFLEKNSSFGAVTCRVELPGGKIDYSSHRGLPTPLNSLSYFLGLTKLFPKSKFFSGYTATYLDTTKPHEIECATGAFLLVRRAAGEMFGWWDEDYFWNGDDIEFCYNLKKYNWKIMYMPQEKIIHYKGSSSGLWTSGKGNPSSETRMMATLSATKAMKIFLQKHYSNSPSVVLLYIAIFILEKFRIAKIRLGIKHG